MCRGGRDGSSRYGCRLTFWLPCCRSIAAETTTTAAPLRSPGRAAELKRPSPTMEGALKELPEELLLPMEGEVNDLPTPPEGGLKDLLPPTEGALEELPEGLLLPVEGGVKDLLPPVEGALE